MDIHVKDYFRQISDEYPSGKFHKVIALHEAPDIDWKSISLKIPSLPKGWFELAHLPVKDRLEFLHDYWLTKMPYHPELGGFLRRFFDSMDDIGIFLTQLNPENPYIAQLVYSLKNNGGFFSGKLPASEQEIVDLQRAFPSVILPVDYLAFLQIHNGFNKTTDCTGITESRKMPLKYEEFQQRLSCYDVVTNSKGAVVSPKSLIPFYESFGMPYFQCFWDEWYPEAEMGNVYYSDKLKCISDVDSDDSSCDAMAFPTFTDWLIFYLETFES